MHPSIWPVIAAAAAATAIGYLWYHPRTFGKWWMRYNGITPEMAERGAKRAHIYAGLGFVAFMILAYVLRGLMFSLNISQLIDAIQLSLYVWLGFVAPALLGSVLWEHRPIPLYLINAGYWLFALIIMAVVLFI